tara:strand:- start:136 stop:390 length:255 start_codon:yes stop_codon:yes gene_type:complete
MSYLYNEAIPLGGTGGEFGGKSKALFVNTAAATATLDLYTYLPSGSTASTTRIAIPAATTIIIPLRIWGVSCGAIAGFTAALLS